MDFSPESLSLTGWALLALAALLAGLVDATVGGGGLIQIPALLGLVPQLSPASLMGTNKLASIFGTSLALWRYHRQGLIHWPQARRHSLLAFVGAGLGAACVSLFERAWFKPITIALLLLVLLWLWFKPAFGLEPQPRRYPRLALALMGLIGFYDGFFGPGTGSFLIVVLIACLGQDFLGASAEAKAINWGTNLAALTYFFSHSPPWIALGLWMALFNMAGSFLGTQGALRWPQVYLKRLLLLVVLVLIAKLLWQ